jgi:hypothetical protein
MAIASRPSCGSSIARRFPASEQRLSAGCGRTIPSQSLTEMTEETVSQEERSKRENERRYPGKS